MRTRHALIGLLLGTIALLGSTLVLPSASAAAEPKRGGTLRVAYGNEIANLDFHTAPGYEMMWVAMNVGCGLVNITPDGKFVYAAGQGSGKLAAYRLDSKTGKLTRFATYEVGKGPAWVQVVSLSSN